MAAHNNATRPNGHQWARWGPLGIGLLMVAQLTLAGSLGAPLGSLQTLQGLADWWAGLVLLVTALYVQPALDRRGVQAIAATLVVQSIGSLLSVGAELRNHAAPAWAMVCGAGGCGLVVLVHTERCLREPVAPGPWLALLVTLDWVGMAAASWFIVEALGPATRNSTEPSLSQAALQIVSNGGLLLGLACWSLRQTKRPSSFRAWLVVAVLCRCAALFLAPATATTALLAALVGTAANAALALATYALPVAQAPAQRPPLIALTPGSLPLFTLLGTVATLASTGQVDRGLLPLLGLAAGRELLASWHLRQQRRRLAGQVYATWLAHGQERRAAHAHLDALARLIHDQGALINGLWRVQQIVSRRGQTDLAQHMVDHLDHLQTLADRLRTAVRQPGAPIKVRQTSVDAAAICAAALNAAQDRAGRTGVALRSSRQALGCTIIGDPTALRRVIDNLLTNALDATRSGGLIDLELWNDRAAPRSLTITVRDTGCGLTAAQRTLLFQPRPAQYDGPGMGLGLAIVHELATAMGGAVGVEPPTGKGSAFWIRLPLAAEKQGASDDHDPGY